MIQLNHFIKKTADRFLIFILATGLLSGVPGNAMAMVFKLPENVNDNVVGQIQNFTLKASDTLVEVARVFGVGFNELVAANPKVDPWLPAEGTQIIIPTQYILPDAPRNGVVINIAEMRLYYYPNDGKRLVYTFPLGIGRLNWKTPLGDFKVIEKMEDPVWTVPKSVLAEAKADGVTMPGVIPAGPDNPLGRHALMLDAKGYLIHGTNKPLTIGRRVSHGCLRLYPEDVEQLIERVPRGTSVKIMDQTIKVGRKNSVLYLEIHPPLQESNNGEMYLRTDVVGAIETFSKQEFLHHTWQRVFHIGTQLNGMPIPFVDEATPVKQQNWLLRVESSNNGDSQQPLVSRFEQMALPVLNRQCHPFQTCIDVGPFPTAALRDATAEMIKYGFGLTSSNLIQNAKVQGGKY